MKYFMETTDNFIALQILFLTKVHAITIERTTVFVMKNVSEVRKYQETIYEDQLSAIPADQSGGNES